MQAKHSRSRDTPSQIKKKYTESHKTPNKRHLKARE